MYNIRLLTVLFLCVGACSAYDCTRMDDGVYELSCQAYVICNASVATQILCPPSTTFVQSTRSCGSQFDASYPCNEIVDCTQKADMSHADVNNGCKSYYRCYHGNFYGHHFCPSGLVFDDTIQVCHYPQLVKPPCGSFTLVGK